MDRDIFIVRDGDQYRLLHGQLRLAAQLSISHEVSVDVLEEGMATVIRARGGLLVERGSQRLPLLRNE